MADDHDRLNAVLRDAGVSKTVYALVMPETEAVIDRVIDGGDAARTIEAALSRDFTAAAGPAALAQRIAAALSAEREHFRGMYREAWTQKQDTLHEEFFATWKRWSAPIVALDGASFPYMYPTAGASEALREAISAYGVRERAAGREPVIHTFAGEYEGFAAYAAAANIPVLVHDRARWRETAGTIRPHEQFYISQPSAIDGNVWADFDEFAEKLNAVQPQAELMLDLTYVGCVARAFSVNANHPNIPAVFFSLSKPMGAYYHRIGGCLSRQEYPGLFGNKWFKNLMSLSAGTAFMQAHGVYELPRKYRAVQEESARAAAETLRLPLQAADVLLLATAPPSAQPSPLERYLTRRGAEDELVRVCLTPSMAKLIDSRIDSTVRARPHEKLDDGPA